VISSEGKGQQGERFSVQILESKITAMTSRITSMTSKIQRFAKTIKSGSENLLYRAASRDIEISRPHSIICCFC